MNQLENLLFSLIKYGVEGKELPCAGETSPEMLAEICKLADSHDLLHLVSHALAVEKLGYRNDGKAKYDIQLFSPSGLHFELHFAHFRAWKVP